LRGLRDDFGEQVLAKEGSLPAKTDMPVFVLKEGKGDFAIRSGKKKDRYFPAGYRAKTRFEPGGRRVS